MSRLKKYFSCTSSKLEYPLNNDIALIVGKTNKAIAWVPVLMMGLPPMVMAENVTNWASWVIPTEYPFPLPSIPDRYSYTTGTTGTVVDPNTGETVNLTISGEVLTSSDEYFSLKFREDLPAYTSAVSPTDVTGADMLAASGDTAEQYKSHTLTFSEDITNAVMPIHSLGMTSQEGELTFSQPFVILSSNGRLSSGGDASTGFTLKGNEGRGVIQFLGTYDTISWVVTGIEIWHGMTIGLTTPDNPEAGNSAIETYDLFAEGTGVTAPTRFGPEPEPTPEPEPEPEPTPELELAPQTVLERVLAQIDDATNLAPISGIYANIAENTGGADGAGVDGSVTNIISGVTGISQQAVANVSDMATTIALPTLTSGNMITTALGAVNTGEIVLGLNANVDDATARTTHAVSSVMTQLGGANASGVVVINIASNVTGINGSITNALTMVNGTIDNLSTTALGAVNTGTIISGVDAKVQGIVGLGG
jgi:hypothetical protein